MRDSSGFMVLNGKDSMGFNAQAEKGVNVLDVPKGAAKAWRLL